MKKNTKVQQRLLSETNLTYAKTVKLASAMELAQQGVDCVSGTVTKLKPDILKFSTTKQHNKSNQPRKHSVSNNKPTKPCFRCASTEHTAYECKYKTYTCAYCKKVGHLQSNCFVKKKKKENPKKQNNVNLSDGIYIIQCFQSFSTIQNKYHHGW